MVALLYEDTWDWGNRRVKRKDSQVLRGNGTYWGNVCQGVRPELASVDKVMGGPYQEKTLPSRRLPPLPWMLRAVTRQGSLRTVPPR